MNSKQENNDKVYVSDNKMLYRYPKDDYYADSVSLENGKICMQVGGHTICKSIKDWHKLGNDIKKPISSSDANGSKQESLDDILESFKYIPVPMPNLPLGAIKVGNKIYEENIPPEFALKDQLQAYCNKQVIEELEKVLKTKRQPIMMIGTPFADGVVSSKAIENRIKELKEK